MDATRLWRRCFAEKKGVSDIWDEYIYIHVAEC